LRDESKNASISDDDLYEIIGDWLTTLQKIYAVFFMDLYTIVDGDDPFCAMKLDSVNVGLPKDLAGQYIQPLTEILQRIQKERIEAFNEALRRQQEEEERKYQEELRKQREEEVRQEAERQRLASFKSIKGMELEYQKLDDLLAAKKWRAADELTSKIMLQIGNRASQGYLDAASIQIFPCEDLCTIDQLWVHYSNGKFGFSVQKKLWLDYGIEIGKYNYEVWKKFASKVGWYHPQKDNWKTYNEFMSDTINAHNASPASLPWFGGMGWFGGGMAGISIFSRTETCRL